MKLTIITACLFIISLSIAQKPIEYSFNIQAESQKIEPFIDNLNISENAHIKEISKDSILISDQFKFNNTVIYKESKTYNRVYREQSNGYITFQILVYKKDKQLMVSIGHFKHKPDMKFDNLNFGVITENEVAPTEISAMTNNEYSTEVWLLMKKEINNYSNKIKDTYSGIVSVTRKETDLNTEKS